VGKFNHYFLQRKGKLWLITFSKKMSCCTRNEYVIWKNKNTAWGAKSKIRG